MSDYTTPRQIIDPSGVYLNAQDLITLLEQHKKGVFTGDYRTDAPYSLAHDHIIEIIKLITEA